MMHLEFDAQAMFNDLVKYCLIPSADEAIERFRNDVLDGLKSPVSRKRSKATPDDVEKVNAFLESAGSQIKASCISYGWALLESYGTGIKSDTKNESLASYVGGELWNPLRPDLNIVGRPSGVYKNFFGETVESKGKKAGKSIGGWGKGISPSYAIQNAEKRLDAGLGKSGFVSRILDKNVEKFFNEHPFEDYFIEVSV